MNSFLMLKTAVSNDGYLSFSTYQCYILNMQATYLKVALVWCAASASGRSLQLGQLQKLLIVSDCVAASHSVVARALYSGDCG